MFKLDDEIKVFVPLTVKSPGMTTVVPAAPTVSVLEPIVSNIVLSPDVKSKSVNPTIAEPVAPSVNVDVPI